LAEARSAFTHVTAKNFVKEARSELVLSLSDSSLLASVDRLNYQAILRMPAPPDVASVDQTTQVISTVQEPTETLAH
jgi:hypothetical protein